MTKKKSQNQKFIFLASLLFFSCAEDRNYPSDNVVRLDSYQHYPQNYRPYVRPNSGSYNNPYNNPPRNYYPYYDFDQYYVPPTQYKNVEQNNNSGPSNKF